MRLPTAATVHDLPLPDHGSRIAATPDPGLPPPTAFPGHSLLATSAAGHGLIATSATGHSLIATSATGHGLIAVAAPDPGLPRPPAFLDRDPRRSSAAGRSLRLLVSAFRRRLPIPAAGHRDLGRNGNIA
ncbi:hypothetical protein [Dactylosporangium sp. CA-092794]|uniref:hypothetical protein n=1 Tax=Dactylosporangium sp. CA-092794 TaxID=3239929 RepID=UPI003D927F58